MKNSKSYILTMLLLVLSLGNINITWTMGEGEETNYSDLNLNEPASDLTSTEREQQLIMQEKEENQPKNALKRAIDWLTNKISSSKPVTNVGLNTSHDQSNEPIVIETSDHTSIPVQDPTIIINLEPQTDQIVSQSLLEENINTLFKNNAGLKIKRTDLQSDLTTITRASIPQDATYEQAKEQFIKSATIIRPLLPKNVLLIPIEKPSTQSSNSFATDFQFELVKMDSYDPKLTIEQNAEQMKKSQGLKIQARDTQTNNTRTLAAYIRYYLEENPSKDNLKALLFDNTRGKNGLKEILANQQMQTLFNNLTAQELTEITNKQIAAQPKALMTSSSMLYGAAKHFYQFKADDYQPFFTDKLIIPIETADRNNRASFTFDIIDISKQKSNLARLSNASSLKQIDFTNLSATGHSVEVDSNPLTIIMDIAQKLKVEQNLKLTTVEIAKQLKIYLEDQLKQQQTLTAKYAKIITDDQATAETKHQISKAQPMPLPFLTETELPILTPQDNAVLSQTDSESGISDIDSDFSKLTNSQPDQPKIIRLDSPLTSAQDRTTYLTALTDQLDQYFQNTTTNPHSKISQLLTAYDNLPIIYDPAERRTLTISSDEYGLLDYNWTDNAASKQAFSTLEDSYQTAIKNIKAEISKQVPHNEQIPLSNDIKVTINENTQAEIVNTIFKKYFETPLFDIQNEKIKEYTQQRAKDEDIYEQQQYDERMSIPTNRPNPLLAPEAITLSAKNVTKTENTDLTLYLNNKMNELFTPEKMMRLQQSNLINEDAQDQFVKMRIKEELYKLLPIDQPITLLNGKLVQITQDLQTQLVQTAWENNFVRKIPKIESTSTAIPWGVFVYQPSK